MHLVSCRVIRYCGEEFPPRLEIGLRDIAGDEHLIDEKLPVLGVEIAADEPLPPRIWIEVETVGVSDEGVRIRLAHAVESLDGQNEFVVLRASVLPETPCASGELPLTVAEVKRFVAPYYLKGWDRFGRRRCRITGEPQRG